MNRLEKYGTQILDPVLEISMSGCEANIPLFPGEKIDPEINGREVTYICPYEGHICGYLYLTNYKLFFRNDDEKEQCKTKLIMVPLCTIYKIDKFGGANNKSPNSYGINIICKDVRVLKFAHNPENHSRRDVFEKLKQYAFPLTYSSVDKLFCYHFKVCLILIFTFFCKFNLYL